jgi:hypothetical protein
MDVIAHACERNGDGGAGGTAAIDGGDDNNADADVDIDSDSDVRVDGTASASVHLSHTSGWLSVPKELPNKVPLDVFISNIFENTHQHPWVERTHLKWRMA